MWRRTRRPSSEWRVRHRAPSTRTGATPRPPSSAGREEASPACPDWRSGRTDWCKDRTSLRLGRVHLHAQRPSVVYGTPPNPALPTRSRRLIQTRTTSSAGGARKEEDDGILLLHLIQEQTDISAGRFLEIETSSTARHTSTSQRSDERINWSGSLSSTRF